MADPRSMNALSILDLVASDAAYKTLQQYEQDRAANATLYLQSWPDSSAGNEASFPASLLNGLANEGLTAHDPMRDMNGSHGGGDAAVISFTNWKLIKKFQDDTTGFGAAVFKSTVPNSDGDQYIVAFQGSDGLDGRDWYQNLDMAQGAWTRNGPSVINFLLDGGQGLDGEEYVPSTGIVHFTGQSLGGALAQYGAYFYARHLKDRGAASLRDRLTLIDFNGFGAVAGVDAVSNEVDGFNGLPSARYDKTLLAGVPTIHYAIDNDIVHRLGRGNPADFDLFGRSWHVNGSGNSYTFNFRRSESGDQNKLNLVDAHRIESGFYRGFERYGSTFATASNLVAGDYAYLNTRFLQNTGALLSRILSDGTADELSGYARLALGVLGAAAVGPLSEIRELQKAVVDSAFDAGEITSAQRTALRNGALPIGIKALVIQSASAVSRVLGPIGWLFSIGIEIFSRLTTSEAQAIVQAQNRLLPSDRGLQYHAVTDMEATQADWIARYETYSLFAAQYAEPADRGIVLTTAERLRFAADLYALEIDPNELGATVMGGADWISDTAILIESALVASGASAQQWARTNADVIAFFATTADDIRPFDALAADRMKATLRQFAREGIGKALASANSDATVQAGIGVANAFEGSTLSFDQYRDYRTALAGLLDDEAFGTVRSYLETALAEIDRGGERPIIEVFAAKPTNPFNDPSFDPEAATPVSAEIKEGNAGTYVLFLPYAAAPEGQRVRVDLVGTSGGEVSVFSNGTSIPVTDGAFYVTVPEGRKEVSFAVTVGDIDNDATVSVSATLVDAAGNPTHRTHLEANLTLTNDDDVFQSSFNASTSINFANVDEITGRFDQNDPTASRTELFGTDKGDLVVADHAAESIETRAGNDFITESAGSGTGTYTAADDIDAGAGNDIVSGYIGGEIRLGDGDDFVNANDRIQLGATRLTNAGSESLADVPAEIFSDVARFIRIRPSGDDPQFNPLVGSLDFAYFLDFGEENLDHPASGVSSKMGVVGSGPAARIERTSSGGASFSFVTVDGIANITYSGGATPLAYGVAFERTGDLHNTQAVVVDGGAGNDILYGAGGEDFIRGGAGDDRIAGFASDDTLFAEDGADRIVAGAGDDYIDAGSGDDRAWGEDGNDELLGGLGSDELYGGEGVDYLDGAAGNDFLITDAGADEAYGGSGDDYLNGGDGDDYLDGEAGSDILSGGGGNDQLQGGEGADQVSGGDGDDYLDGEQGDDVLVGDSGRDTLFGGDGNDVLSGEAGDDVLDGEQAADQLAGGDGADTVYGGEGNDLLWGQANDDYLDGGDGDDQLDGAEGNDTLRGDAGTDVLLGGAGDDVYDFSAGDGRDLIEDATGVNRLRFSEDVLKEEVVAGRTDPALGTQYVVLSYGVSDSVYVRRAADIQSVSFADGTSITLEDLLARNTGSTYVRAPRLSLGTSSSDFVAPTTGDALAFGRAGDDQIYGGPGHDALYGGDGSDSLSSGDGNDTLVGGAGTDILNGGGGANTYVFSRGDGADAIWNGFSGGQDTLQLKDLSRADVSLSHASNGDLKIRVRDTNDTVTIPGFYSSFGSHLEHIVYGDGSQEDMSQLSALGRTPISVDSDGHAIGTPDDDTLIGDSTDNVLDGGAGNDVLMGGAGTDTYLSQIGMGHDIAIEAAGEFNIVKLALGIDVDQLIASRQSNDLVLGILGSDDSLALQDYYSGGHQWNVVAADGRSKSLPEVLEELADLQVGDLVKWAQDKWEAASRNAVFRWLGDAFGGGFMPAGPDLYKREDDDSTSYLIAPVRSSSSNAAIVYNAYSHYDVPTLAIPTSVTQVVSRPLRGALSSAGLGNPVLDHGHLDANGQATVVGMFNFNGSFFGNLNDLYSGSAPAGRPGMSPDTYMTQEIEHANAVYGENLEFITAGRASNFILPWGITAVDAGAGDDFINATGWLFSPWGSSAGGDLLNGGDGNDRIFGTDDADVLMAGSGTDYLAGMAGHDAYYVLAGEAGKKTIDEAVVRHYLQAYYVTDGGGQSGFISSDTVEFSPGIAVDDLTLSWGQFDSTAVDESGAGKRYGTLNMSWASGSEVRIVLPDLTIPDVLQRMAQYPGESYGIEQFRFADGTVVSMDDMLARATAAIGAPDPTRYVYEAGDGSQILGDLNGLAEITFGPGIDPTSLLISGRAGDDVFLRIGASDSLRINDWFAEQSVDLRFDDGTVWDATILGALPAFIVGTDDADTLFAPEGSDNVLVGLHGDDQFFGSSRSDTYVFGRGDGADTLYDHVFGPDPQFNTISFTADITPDDVGVTRDDVGNLYLVVNEDGGRIVLSGWFDEDGSGKAFGARFADGTQWSAAELESKVRQLAATTFSDVLAGTDGDDVVLARAGDDLLFGMAGNDLLDGGAGSDRVEGGPGLDILRGGADDDVIRDSDGRNLIDGGAGADWLSTGSGTTSFWIGGPGADNLEMNGSANNIFAFNRGDGEDSIPVWFDDNQPLTLSLGGGITLADLSFVQEGSDIVVDAGAGDRAHLSFWYFNYPHAETRLQLIGDGHVDVYDLVAAVDYWEANGGPTSAALQANHLSTYADQAYGGALAYEYATTGNLAAIPAPGIRSFLTSADFGVEPQPIAFERDQAPELVSPIADQSADEDSRFEFTVPADTFTATEGVTYTARLASGDDLPAWLHFDAGTLTFSGTPAQGDVGTIDLHLAAAVGGLSADDTFAINVANVNDEPQAGGALGQRPATQDQPFAFVIPGNAFTDEDPADHLSFAVSGLPAWLSFDPVTRSFSGTPGNADVGEATIEITARDDAGATASSAFDIVVANVNDAPSPADDLASVTEDGVPETAGNVLANDGDVDPGTHLAVGSPGVLQGRYGSLDIGADGSFSYTLDNASPAVQALNGGEIVFDDFGYAASDGTASTPATLRVSIAGRNDSPIAAPDAAVVVEDADLAATGNVLANDFDADSASSLAVVNAGIYEDPASRLGRLTLHADGSYEYALNNVEAQALGDGQVVHERFSYVTSDGYEPGIDETLDITIQGANDAPGVAKLIADFFATEDQPFGFSLPPGAFTDVDRQDELTYAATRFDGTPLPDWLSFDAATRTFEGTPANADVGVTGLKVVATDRLGASASQSFALIVANVNDAPEVASDVADQLVEAGTALSFTVPQSTFRDVDADDTLTFSASALGGGALPSWLNFDPTTALFSGTPQTGDIGVSAVEVHATDAAGASAAADFALILTTKAGASVSGSGGADVIFGGSGNETLSGGGGGDALFGLVGNDVLRGGKGNDVMQGGEGADVLHGGKGNNVLDGGSGSDVIFDGGGSAFIAGGTGADTIRVGGGRDVLAYNRGDGTDTIIGGGDGGNTLSLGGGIRYSDLSLSKAGRDLIVNTGGDDRITLKDWYGDNHSLLTLQMIADASEDFDASMDPLRNHRIETFNFLGLVSAFDQARVQSPGLTSWALTNALLQFHLAGSDDAALGGDLAYWYGRRGSLAGMSLSAAQQVIGAAGFGADAQQLHPFSGLQDGLVKLG